MRLCLRLHNNISVVVNGQLRDFGGEDQSKMQTQMHSMNEPINPYGADGNNSDFSKHSRNCTNISNTQPQSVCK